MFGRAGAFWGVCGRELRGCGAVGGAWGWAALRGALSGGSDEQGQVADVLQGGGEGRGCQGQLSGRRSLCRPLWLTRRARHGEEPVADGGRDGELCVVGWSAAEAGGPAQRGCARARQQASQAPLAGNRPGGAAAAARSLL